MTAPAENQPQISDKELNFRKQEAMYQRMLNEKEQRIAELQQASQKQVQHIPEEEEETEPYVDHKKLKKKLDRYGQQMKEETQTEIQRAVQKALAEERRQRWLKENPDFESVMTHAEKLAIKDPELADDILSMPNNFERSKLVYKSIKLAGLHEDKKPLPSVQDKIDANRRSPYYQPSGVGSAPYNGSGGDFSLQGQKNAYDKLQALKANLRL